MNGVNYDKFEKNYNGQKWWEEMKQRRKNKTEEQKDLDRKLVQHIGEVTNNLRMINLTEIKKLVDQGAQIDHWVEFAGGRYNAIQLAANNGSDEAVEAVIYLLNTFNFIPKELGNDYSSPLALSIFNGYSKMAKEIIKIKKSKNPIYSFLRWSLFSITDDEKLNSFEEIRRNYNFSKILKEDLKLIKDHGQFDQDVILTNLSTLFNFCKSKNINLEECLGKSYNIGNPIAWRFKSGNTNHWVAEEIQKTFKVGKVSIENCPNKITVFFVLLLSFLFIFLDLRFPMVKNVHPVKQRPIRSRFCQISFVENSCWSKTRN